MGFIAETLSFRNKSPNVPFTVVPSGSGLATLGAAGFETFVREGYQKNEIVYSAIELLATSAAEPHIVARRYRDSEARDEAKAFYRWADVTGYPRWAAAEVLSRKQVQQDLGEREHPLPRLLNRPNPYVSRFQLWSTVIMDRYLAGNAYLLKARGRGGRTAELWRLRPDRVKVIPSSTNYIDGYEYKIGTEIIRVPAQDIIHFKTRNPLDEYYGQSPLMALASRVDIDNYMQQFVRMFFRRGGQPGAILSVKQKLTQDAKDEIRERFRSQFGTGNWFELMVLDSAESSYTPMTLQLGQRGLVVPELNNITEARIAMAFGIPASILGLLVGLESSSYANKRQDWQVLWDITLAPMYSDLDDVLNLTLTPEFPDVDEVLFDLSQVRALQEDVDKLHDRARKNVQAGLWTIEEARILTGVDAKPSTDGHFLIPSNVMPSRYSDLDGLAEPAPEQQALAALRSWITSVAAPAQIAQETETRTGRPRVEDDELARELFERGEAIRREHPGITLDQVAGRIGIAVSTYKRYRAVFRVPQ